VRFFLLICAALTVLAVSRISILHCKRWLQYSGDPDSLSRVSEFRNASASGKDSSQAIWYRKVKAFNVLNAARKAQLQSYDPNKETQKHAFDIYEPVWNCELKSRLGSVPYAAGDGPKFVCAVEVLRSLHDCVVFSIGSHWDFSFEYAIHATAPSCQIHTFDGTMDIESRPVPSDLKEKNIHFHNWSIDGKRGSNAKTIQDTAAALSITRVDLLKIDCEGCEYSVLRDVFGSTLRVQQILNEIHVGNNSPSDVASLFHAYDEAGFLVFSKERNHWGCDGWRCVEYSLISFDFAQLAFEAYLTGSGGSG
jgi:FkbM family methyltransferase